MKDQALALVHQAKNRGQALNALREYLQALLTRRYSKGRDWYDLVWYLSQRPPVEPNLSLLENALKQTAMRTRGGDHADAHRWRETVRSRLLAIDMKALLADVGPFLERPQDATLITRENLLSLLDWKK